MKIVNERLLIFWTFYLKLFIAFQAICALFSGKEDYRDCDARRPIIFFPFLPSWIFPRNPPLY